MKPIATATAKSLEARSPANDAAWRERSGRLFAEFERPAKAMIRRAFRGAFCADELDDIYASSWVGTLRALAGRQSKLSDDEIRSYVLTAVANQASKELRRRKRKPTAPLELVGSVADSGDSPEEQAAGNERSQVTRDLLASLPPRRRAVMLLRYGWGLEPRQVCDLVKGLSPRAYRKEITRGVDEMAEKMRAVEAGSWCADREPILKSFVAGLAGEEEQRQAKAHLAHCRHCSDFVARLSGHLHDLGSGVALLGAVDGIDGHARFADRLVAIGDRAASMVGRSGGTGADDGTAQVAASGGARGAGAAGAGVMAKLAGFGVAGKVALACVGGGIAATACVAAGVAPFGLGAGHRDPALPAARAAAHRHPGQVRKQDVEVSTLPTQVGNEAPPPATAPSGDSAQSEPVPAQSSESSSQTAAASTMPTVAATATPQEQEFGVAAAAVPAPTPSAPATSSGSSGSSTPSETSAVHQEFGP